jgi:hypothetical protein
MELIEYRVNDVVQETEHHSLTAHQILRHAGIDPESHYLEVAHPEHVSFQDRPDETIGTNNWDMSLYRKIPFTERFTGQLRFETYNTFNHTQFNAVNSNLQFNTLGQQINSAFMLPTGNRPPRYVQLAFRLMF